MVVRLKENVQDGVASQRYFKEMLWPRLVRLSEERGRASAPAGAARTSLASAWAVAAG